MQVPKVAIDARLISTHNTGDTSYWIGLISGLVELDSDFRLFLYSNTDQPKNVPDDPRIEWVCLPQKNRRIWSLKDFPRNAANKGAQLIHTQYNVSPFAKIPSVTTIHDVSFLINPKWFKMKDRLILKSQIPMSARIAKKIFTVSETSKSEIEHFLPFAKGKITVTPNALGNNIKPLSKDNAKEFIKSNLGIAEPFVFTLGTRWPRKNLELAIRACNNLADAFPHKLVITGQPGWGSLPKSDRIIFTDYVEDETLSALYSAADLYLAPSWHEGFGIPLLEAFACQCPVLCSPGGALPEVAGNAAVVAPDFEPATWTNVIQSLLTDSSKVESMKQAGLKRVKDFSWKSSAEITFQGYQEVLSK